MKDSILFQRTEDEMDFIHIIPLNESDNETSDGTDIPDELPVIPLRNTVLFPGVVLPITVGRDKSIKAVNDAYKADKLIGPIYLQAGPAFSVLMDQNKNFLQNGGDAFSKGDFSMIGGAQIKLSKLYLSGRYVVGLANINDIDDKDKWKSQAIQLSVGLSL